MNTAHATLTWSARLTLSSLRTTCLVLLTHRGQVPALDYTHHLLVVTKHISDDVLQAQLCSILCGKGQARPPPYLAAVAAASLGCQPGKREGGTAAHRARDEEGLVLYGDTDPHVRGGRGRGRGYRGTVPAGTTRQRAGHHWLKVCGARGRGELIAAKGEVGVLTGWLLRGGPAR